jgi:cytosine deaminase
MRWPPQLGDGSRFILADAAVPSCQLAVGAAPAGDRDGLARADITIADERIERVDRAGERQSNDSAPRVDLGGCQVWPCFVDMHTHLDKGHIWPRTENPDGTFAGALTAARADREAWWSENDIEARFEFGLRTAHAHGTAAIRTHLDSLAPQHALSWPLFARLRERWRGRIDLQAVTILMIDHLQDRFGDELADTVARHGGVLGAVVPQSANLDAQLDRIFALAAARGLDLDFHADETGDPDAAALPAIARAKLRNGFRGGVVVGHCCSLALQPPERIEATLDIVAEAELAIVSLPMCNLFLQDRAPGRTPRWRGVTLLHELRARGIRVAIASDNCRDPFYGYGDHDMLEVFREAVRIAQLDRPIDGWPASVTRQPAAAMALPQRGVVATGAPADLVLFNARSYSELLSRPQSDRIVLRGGRAIDTALPDYRELDRLLA